jgi:orotate phosphoribosyltransferase
MTPSDIGAATATLLLQADAVRVSRSHPFFLAAGWASPVYVDCRLLIATPERRRAMTALAAAAASATQFDAIAGAETAGIPFGTLLAEQLGLPLRYVRKRPLGVGHHAQVEGGPVAGMRVLLVDDLTTDAASKLAFTRGLRAAGATVSDVVTIFYHAVFPGVAARLEQAQLTLHALATWQDILKADAGNWLAAEDRSELEQFLANPAGWSALHGGR